MEKRDQLREAVAEFKAHQEAMIILAALIIRLTAEIKDAINPNP